MKQSLAGNAAYNIIYRLLNVLFPLISAGYVARVLGPEGVGKVANAQNIASYFVMFAVLGIPSYGTREIARCREDQDATDKLFSELFLLNGISTTVCLIAYTILVRIISPQKTTLFLVVGMEVAFNYFNIDWFYQAREDYGYITLRSIFVKVVSLMVLFLCVKDIADYPVYALIHSLGIGCNYFFNVFYARKFVRLKRKGLNLGCHIAPIMWLMLSSVAASLYNKVDITMLGSMSADSSVAYYTNAHKIISIVLTLVTAVSAVFLPRLSFVYIHDRKKYDHYINTGLKIVLLLAVPACVGVVFVADDLMLVLFGRAFLPGASVLRILAVFTVIKGVGDLLCYQAIISSGKEKLLITSRILGGAANVVLNFFLIPAYAHDGAAVASVVSELVVNCVLLPYALQIAKVKLSKGFIVSITAGTAAMAMAVWGFLRIFAPGIWSLCGAVVVGIATYGAMLLITKNELVQEIRGKMLL